MKIKLNQFRKQAAQGFIKDIPKKNTFVQQLALKWAKKV